jgi:hypothetical protein
MLCVLFGNNNCKKGRRNTNYFVLKKRNVTEAFENNGQKYLAVASSDAV